MVCKEYDHYFTEEFEYPDKSGSIQAPIKKKKTNQLDFEDSIIYKATNALDLNFNWYEKSKEKIYKVKGFNPGLRMQVSIIQMNTSKNHPILGPIGARVIALLKPIARLLDVAFSLLKATFYLCAGFISLCLPLSKIVKMMDVNNPVKYSTPKEISRKAMFNEAFKNYVWAGIYMIDLPCCLIVNLINPKWYQNQAKRIGYIHENIKLQFKA